MYNMLLSWPHLAREPVIQLRAAVGVGNKFNAEPDFGEGRRADVEQVERLRGDKAWREGRLEHDAMKLNHLRHCEEHSDEAIQENLVDRIKRFDPCRQAATYWNS
jgi:hypothetical protein